MIDSHCHLGDKKFDGEIENIIKNFSKNGVDKVLNVSTNIDDCVLSYRLADRFENVYYAIGVHPEDVDDFNEAEFEFCLNKMLGERATSFDEKLNEKYQEIKPIFDKNGMNKLLAIGEIGLDYFWTKENKEKQIDVFEKQVKLAKKYNLPFIVHNRDASGDVLKILKRNAPYSRGGIIHCFSASFEWAKEVMDLGFYISFSGSVTFKNAKNLQEVAKLIPLNKILVETDSPYLAPEPHRGERNEPKNVVETAKFVAKLKNISYDEFEKINDENFNRLFNVKK